MIDDVIHYEPPRRRRYQLDLEASGEAIFDELDTDAQEDVVQCVGRKLQVPYSDVKKRLRGKRIPVYLVDPEMLIGDEGRDVRTEDVREYEKMLSDDLTSMPPVLIDSDLLEYPLCEGGHRTVAAIQAELPRIYAIDVAKAYIHGDEIRFRR